MKTYLKISIVLVIILCSCVQKEHKKTVTFFVNMNGIENVKSVGIRGDFLPNKWKKTVPMTDENNDGIYEITFSEETATYGIEFKFVKNNIEFELQGEDNRELVFEYNPETIKYIAIFNNNETIKINRN
tara:strand:+ start:2020 stop:2406 length:387 start_codon:yes stop_codon:yes gene_type:complete